MSEWRVTTMDRLGAIFDGPHATPTRIDHGPYFLNIASLSDGRLNLDESDHVSEQDFTRWTRRVTPRHNDLLFSYETRLGEAALMPEGVMACLGRRMALLRPNRGVVDPRFLLYLYLGPTMQKTIELNTIHGATVNRIPLNRMGRWEVRIPDVGTQQAIAEVLGALDDKIAANTALAANADEIVRAEYSAIPASEFVRVSDIAESPRLAVDPSTVDPDSPYVGLEHIPRRSMWLSEFGTAADVSSGKSQFSARDVLFGKLRPYFHKVVSAPVAGICSTDVLVVRAKTAWMSSLLLAALSSDQVVREVVSASEGTRMPRTSWKDLAAVQIAWPDQSMAEAVAGRLAAVQGIAEAALVENRTLAATRDALLPQLMSGTLRVRDAEATASQAGA